MDLIDYVYLHPKEHVDNNLNTNESLSNYYYTASNKDLSLSNVPLTFNEHVYLNNLSNNLLLNISSLNNDIYDSMILSGYSSNDVRPTYIPIYHSDVYYIQNNIFSSPYLSTSNLIINDNVYLLENNSTYIYANITNIINDNTFELGYNNYNPNKYYKLLGLGIYDPLRTAIISFLTNSNELTRYEYNDEFNPDLYRLLYTNTKYSSKENAYIDYLNNYPSRIGSTDELLSQRISPKDNLDILELNNRLDLRQGSFLLFNGIKIDGISTNSISTSCNLPLGYDYFITERASKGYIDSKLYNYDNVNIIYGINDIKTISGSNYIHGLNKELFTTGDSLYNLNITGNNVLSDLYSKNINSENINYILIKIDISFDIINVDKNNIIIQLASNYECMYKILNIEDEIMLFYNKYKITNIDGLEIHLAILNLTNELTPLSNPIFNTLYILSNKVIQNQLYTTVIDSNSKIVNINTSYEYILVDKEYLLKNTSNSYIDITNDYNYIPENRLLYEEIVPFYDTFTIYEKQWIDSKVVTLQTTLTFEKIYKFKYAIISTIKYVILNVKRNYNDPNYKTLITISRFDEIDIGFDTGLGNYVLINDNNLTDNTIHEVYFYIENKNDQVLKVGTNFISLDDSYLNCGNNLLVSSNNIIIRGEVFACDDNLKIKNTEDGILLDGERIYLCSSNLYIDKLGNLNTLGQISSPYFSSEVISSQSNIITNLISRIEELEAIIQKYNLFL